MLHKLRKNISKHRFTSSNRLPLQRARQFLMNRFRAVRSDAPSAPLRAAMGLVRWSTMRSFHRENRVAFRASCFITGRSRGTSQRFTVARSKIKHLSSEGRLFGVRKSSW